MARHRPQYQPLSPPDRGIARRGAARHTIGMAALLASTALTPLSALANPQNGTVVAGSATISQPNANTIAVQQQTDKAVINWQAFSIAPGESTIFHQPSASSIALNRVTGLDPSSIAGTLKANGILFLVNPNGVVFTSTAHVDVNGLVATTSDIANSDFMAGRYNFTTPGNPNASIVNQGTITAREGGLVGLVAPSVRNDGIIVARLGKVALGSGDAFALDLYGDQLIQFEVPVAATTASTPSGPAITNTGKISAQGGTVWLGVDTARRVVDQAINTTGVIEATAVHQHNGEIVLDGGAGTTTVDGTLDASGQRAGQTGGTVKLLGRQVHLTKNAKINVSGANGGGTALIGGNFHGAGPERNAQTTSVDSGAIIDADALSSGNGGQVAVWSDNTTAFNGAISALGGSDGGNGGFVETSSKQSLSVQTGQVDTYAVRGATGDWLLDPDFINVATGGLASLANVGSFGANAGTTQTIAPNTIASANSNVTLQAASNITFLSPVMMLNNGVGITAQAGGNVDVEAPITTRGGNIVLSASDPSAPPGHSGAVIISAPIRTDGGGVAGGSVTLKESNPVAGEILFNPAAGNITTKGGTIQLIANAPGTNVDIFLAGIDALTNTQLTLDTTGGGTFSSGAPIISSAILGTNFGRQRLTLSAGSNDLTFSGSVSVGGMTIASARNVTSNSFITANNFFTDTNQTGNLTLPGGLSTRGQKGATISGNQNAGPVAIATPGDVNIGTDQNSLIVADGGFQQSTGQGGNGAFVSIVGRTVTLSGISTRGGTPGNAFAAPGSAGDIGILADTISLRGYASGTFGSAPGLFPIALNADGGTIFNSPNSEPQNIAGTGGTIELHGHLVLRGGASTMVLIDNTSVGPSRSIIIDGAIDASSPYAEMLYLEGGHGLIQTGNIGANTPLGDVRIRDNLNGSVGSITAGGLSRFVVSGLNFGSTTTTFNGPVNISGTATLDGANLIFNDSLTVGGAASFNTANLTAKSVTVSGPTTITGDTVITTSPTNGSLRFASIDGAQAFTQSLTLTAGQFGTISTGQVGASVPLRSFIRTPAAQPAQQTPLNQFLTQMTTNSNFLDLQVANSTPPTVNSLPTNQDGTSHINVSVTTIANTIIFPLPKGNDTAGYHINADFLAHGPGPLSDPTTYFSGDLHLGVDLKATKGEAVYAPVSGSIVYYHTKGNASTTDSPEQTFIVLQGTDGKDYVLGHVECTVCKADGVNDSTAFPANQVISGIAQGAQIGVVADMPNAHLHFGVNDGSLVDASGKLKAPFLDGKWGDGHYTEGNSASLQTAVNDAKQAGWINPATVNFSFK